MNVGETGQSSFKVIEGIYLEIPKQDDTFLGMQSDPLTPGGLVLVHFFVRTLSNQSTALSPLGDSGVTAAA